MVMMVQAEATLQANPIRLRRIKQARQISFIFHSLVPEHYQSYT
jgi:hypothetical protein